MRTADELKAEIGELRELALAHEDDPTALDEIAAQIKALEWVLEFQ